MIVMYKTSYIFVAYMAFSEVLLSDLFYTFVMIMLMTPKSPSCHHDLS